MDLVARLENKIDQLLEQHQLLQQECRSLRESAGRLQQEREHFRQELDRIIDKLEKLERLER